MHEMQIAQNIVDTVLDCFPDCHEPITKVTVHIGNLNHIISDSLKFYFEVISKEYEFLKNADLEIVKIPVNTLCPSCGKKKVNLEPNFICECGSSLQIISGEEIILESCTTGEENGN